MDERFGAPVKTLTATIANAATKSDVIDTEHYRISALHMPAVFTGTAITYESAPTGDGTFQAVNDDAGVAISTTVAAAKVVGITGNNPSMALAGLRFLKLVSDQAEGAERKITVELHV